MHCRWVWVSNYLYAYHAALHSTASLLTSLTGSSSASPSSRNTLGFSLPSTSIRMIAGSAEIHRRAADRSDPLDSLRSSSTEAFGICMLSRRPSTIASALVCNSLSASEDRSGVSRMLSRVEMAFRRSRDVGRARHRRIRGKSCVSVLRTADHYI